MSWETTTALTSYSCTVSESVPARDVRGAAQATNKAATAAQARIVILLPILIALVGILTEGSETDDTLNDQLIGVVSFAIVMDEALADSETEQGKEFRIRIEHEADSAPFDIMP